MTTCAESYIFRSGELASTFWLWEHETVLLDSIHPSALGASSEDVGYIVQIDCYTSSQGLEALKFVSLYLEVLMAIVMSTRLEAAEATF